MIIRNKFNGYVNGTRLYNGGGGGATTSYQTNIPKYLQPYVTTMLGAAEQQIYTGTKDKKGIFQPTGFKPFQSYAEYDRGRGGTGESVAGFTPMQLEAMKGIRNYQLPGQTGAASAMTSDLAGRALGAGQYDAGQFDSQFKAPEAYQAGQFNAQQVSAPELEQYQMKGPADVTTQSITAPGSMEAYMSPYQQQVADIQKREAIRRSNVMQQESQAQAVKAGAYGGSRQAIVEAARQRDLAQQLGDIQAQSSQAGFQNAQQQFNVEQQARLQAALANQQTGYNVGAQNLAAQLGIQQLGAGQNLQSQLANQQYGMTAQQLAEQSRQFGAGQGMNAAQLAAQYGLSAQQLGEQSRQFGAGLGLQGIQQALGAAGQLGSLGQQQYAQELGLLGQQYGMGEKQQQYEQQRLNQIIQDYATSQQYPFMQMGILNSMLRGLPMQSATTSMYQAQPTNLQSLIGTYGALSNLPKKEGGAIKEMASGGIASGVDPYKLPSMAKKLSDQQLQQKLTDPQTDPDTKGIMQAESQRRQEVRGMASGGVVAFKEGKKVDDVENPFEKNKEDKEDKEELKGMFPIAKGAAEGKPAISTEKPAKQAKAPKSEGIMAKPAAAPAPAKENPEDFYGRYQKRIAPALEEARRPDEYQTDLVNARKKAMEDLNKTDAQRLQEQQDKLKAAGVNTDFMTNLKKTYSEQLDKMADETNEQKALRRAQAWAIFGSTPGPMLKVGLQALNAYIDQEIEDDKARKKARNELNKAIYEVDHADYLIKAGQIEKADAAKADAFKRVDGLNTDIAKIRQRDREAQLQATAEGAKSAMGAEARIAEQRIQTAGQIAAAGARGAGADKEEKSIQAQTRAARAELQKWDNSEEGKALARAESILSNPNLKGDGRKTFEADRDRLIAKRNALKKEVMNSYPGARLEEPPAPAAPAAPSAADISFTAKKYGISEEEVKKRLGIK